MNRYPLWMYVSIVALLVAATLFTLPNFFGESPAVQISAGRSTVKVDESLQARVQTILAAAKLSPDAVLFENGSVKARFKDGDTQLKAQDALKNALDDDYVTAQNLLPRTPNWLTSIGAKPMSLGLDLRGGVHFLLEVDMKAAVDKDLEKTAGNIRRELKDKKIRFGRVVRERDTVEIQLRDAATVDAVDPVVRKLLPTLQVIDVKDGSNNKVVLSYTEAALLTLKDQAVKQNVTTLHNRVNELGVAEPVIQQQGQGRIVVELPGIQDTAKAKDILGRTASLEVRMVEDDAAKLSDARNGNVPAGYELMNERSRDGQPRQILVKKEIELTGENITDAQAGFDDHNEPAVHITLDSNGATIFRDLTHDNVGKRMAMILVEKGKGEVVTAPVIRGEIGGGRVQISGAMSTVESTDTALLLRAGSLAAPMNIVEERTIGPSLGKENIEKGFHSTLYGFLAIAVFMLIYYRIFGVVSALALVANLLLLLAALSILGVTLTLPGIAAIALTLGMAIDSNVLINERVREELRNGVSPQLAITNGYKHALDTILDSNVTTLIAGLALLIFGSGAVRGFAWVHCIGIVTSFISAVFVSRGIINLIYGYRRRLTSLSIGQVWVPEEQKA
ncbi:preprotein translocase subunit SecD [Andreprevotia lacus DSM 23236]|jgi:preprotein translocase subunit SecD|uniref:Protein translocase subunit SecD n=1 Tax=Andreprevotia lacus DSM 23236 TaxID=1121001 RepID=A0A1W1XLC3_9NEIS|nr:protein translocase subunit SecD [Andreprevotia lacus]SMC24328.1 preprotein translocase subunit SecD [Andreprevotia lacus DSM 23236]